MNSRVLPFLQSLYGAVTGSYSQIFFSDSKAFALLLLLASFLDPWCGMSGLLAVIITILTSKMLGLNSFSVANGSYSFNSLLTGLMMGYYYTFSIEFFTALFLVSLLTLFITVLLETLLRQSGLPFLSFPFMFSVWAVLLGSRSMGAFTLNERGIYTLNELWGMGGESFVRVYEHINSAAIPLSLSVYLKSLGAIFFQPDLIAGLLVAGGLLLFSRIAFMLSLLGFFTGYLFYYFIGGNFSDIQYSYIGFNFILSAIALGGFFTIPSPSSFLLVILITPITGFISSALGNFLQIFQLPVLSLPFNIIVMLALSVLKSRVITRRPEMVLSQQFSPEKNLYKHKNRLERFKNDTYFHIHLPFYGEWTVSQGHAGKHTHKGDWQYAWDFVVTDETKKTYRPPGEKVSDFYCYSLPILAPAAGYVVTISDEVDDNPVGGVDIEHNWGNTIIIKHGEYLYSKISHIKKNSFRVKAGDYVKRGELLASCGNSGRSPEPHIHFQLQAAPYVGAKTIRYPICYFVNQSAVKALPNAEFQARTFHSFDTPEEGMVISRPAITPLIREAFNFIPGAKLNFIPIHAQGKASGEWEIFVDAYNHPYIYCRNTHSYAYFVNNDTLLYFTEFVGNKNSLLYYFYLGAHKILLGYYHRVELKDRLPIEGFYSGVSKIVQDFIAPFYIYLKADYTSVFSCIDDEANPAHIEISSTVTAKAGTKMQRKVEFKFTLKENRLYSFEIIENGKKEVWVSGLEGLPSQISRS